MSTPLNVISGSYPPTFSVGEIGQLYIDSNNGNIYGPKMSSGWPLNPINSPAAPAAAPAASYGLSPMLANVINTLVDFISQYWKEILVILIVVVLITNKTPKF